jgi:heme-degrading monooxygenase HmoA
MIGRIWHGWTTPENADAYQSLLEREVLPGIEEKTTGYDGVYVLRRDDGARVEFITLTLWQSMDAVRTMAGDDVEAAYVPAEARAILADFDERSVHYEVVLTAGAAGS